MLLRHRCTGQCCLSYARCTTCQPIVVFKSVVSLWRSVSERKCLQFTPCVRCNCKNVSKSLMQISETTTVLSGFKQKESRFLFEPRDSFWERQIRVHGRDKVEVQTISADGACESKSWLRRGKGLFTPVGAADLDSGVTPQRPYSFRQEDQRTSAVVRMWPKTVDDDFNRQFRKEQITQEDDLREAGEKRAFMDFKQALSNLLTAADVQQGCMWNCTEVQETLNTHLAVIGKAEEVIKLLNRQLFQMRRGETRNSNSRKSGLQQRQRAA